MFGDKIVDELKPGGENIMVTKENRLEFIQLYLEFLFKKQCDVQLAAFKRGFYKLFDKELLMNLYTGDELEQYICGTKTFQLQRIIESDEVHPPAEK